MAILAQIYDDGWRVALVGEPSRKFTPVVVLESSGLTLRKVPNGEPRPVAGYPIRRALRRFREAGRRFGISPGARRFLKQAEACSNPRSDS